MSEQKKMKKNKISLFDNMGCILLGGYLMILLGQLLGMSVLNPAITAILGALIPGLAASDAWITATLYLMFLGIWILVLLFFALTPANRPLFRALTGKTKGNTLKMFAVGIAIGLGMNLLCAFIAMANGDISLRFSAFRPISFLLLFVAVLIQSAAEELVCRVFIYQRLVRRYGKPVLAAVVNAAFFALIHLSNPGVTFLALLNILVYGLLFSAMVVYMDSPWAAFGAHAAWNFCQNIILGLPNSGNVLPYSVWKLDAAAAADSFAYSVSFGLEGTVTASLTLLVVTGIIVWWGIKRKTVPTNIWDTPAETEI